MSPLKKLLEIQKSTIGDIDSILRLYAEARAVQKEKKAAEWPEFTREFVEQEIQEGRQWKLLLRKEIACIWSITFSDPKIWEDSDSVEALYIHRLVTASHARGQNMVASVVDWAVEFGKHHRLQAIRLDTVGENTGLITYYTKCGFTFLGLKKIVDSDGLPAHYHDAVVSRFEIPVRTFGSKDSHTLL